MKRRPLPILLTASVSTRGMKKAYFTDAERERMYVETLNVYIDGIMQNRAQDIVFVENSGWDLEHLKSRLHPYDSRRLIFISLPPERFDISKGKGYNELLMMNMAIEQCQVLLEARGFVKVTGRYPFYNLPYFVNQASKAIEEGRVLYCDVKDHHIYDWLGLGWSGHSFYAPLYSVRIDYYLQSIAPLYKDLNDYDGRLVEGALYKLMKQEMANGISKWRGDIGNGKIIARFRREPICGGLQGSRIAAVSFSLDQNGWKSKLKRIIGNSIRILTPWFWF